MRRRIRDHDRREILRVRFRFRFEVGEIDVAVLVTGDDDDLEAHHMGGGGIRSVRRCRDQAHVAMALAATPVVRLDCQKSRELTLRAGVGLQRNRSVPGDRAEHPLEISRELQVTRDLIRRRERMHVRELGPRDRNHLGRSVELHRAGPERNHRAVERDVAIGETPEVTQHLRLGMVAVEDGMGEERRRSHKRRGQRVGDACIELVDREADVRAGEDAPDTQNVVACRRLVERYPERRVVHAMEIHPGRHATGENRHRARAGRDRDRVEERVRWNLEPGALETRLQDRGQPAHAARDLREALRPVVDRVHRRDHRE